MKKKIPSLLIAVLILIFSAVPVFAESHAPLLEDNAGLLTETEAGNLLSKLSKVSRQQQMDIVIITVWSLGGKSPAAFADDFYDSNGYNKDGVLLLIGMASRDQLGWEIPDIKVPEVINDEIIEEAFNRTKVARDYILDEITPKLSDGEYADAFNRYAELCDEFITEARNGNAYDVGNLPKGQFNFVINLLIALAVGFLVAFIVTGVMRSSLKSVKSQPTADNYIKNGSVNITRSRDMFLYRHISRRAIPKNNSSGGSSTHMSSSGSFHGGGGRKF